MNCNICGAELAPGTTNCPVCGSPVANQSAAGQNAAGSYSMAGGNNEPSNPFGAMQNPQSMGAANAGVNSGMGTNMGYDPMAQSSYSDPYAAPTSAPTATKMPKKTNMGLIIGIIVCVLAIGTVVLLFVLGVFSGKDGVYKFESINYGGIEITKDTLDSYGSLLGVDFSTFQIEISGDTATVSIYGESQTCKVSFDGNNVTFTTNDGSKTLNGTKDGNRITIEESGGKIVFKK